MTVDSRGCTGERGPWGAVKRPDRRAFAPRCLDAATFVVIGASTRVLVAGVALALTPTAGFATALAQLNRVGRWPLVVVLISTSIVGLASLAAGIGNRMWLGLPGRVVLALPQQMVLFAMAAAAVQAIASAQFGDGVIRSRAFIGVDQSPLIIWSIVHAAALIYEAGRADDLV